MLKGKISARQELKLNKIEEELPSISQINTADDLEVLQIVDAMTTNTEEITHQAIQTDDIFEYPLRELLGLDKELKNIRGSLKVEIAKKVYLQADIDRNEGKLQEMENDTSYTDGQRERVKERLNRLNEGLNVRRESIDILKGKLTNQITGIKATITKVLDKDTSLGEKIKTLFREQGIALVSILTAFGMTIGVLVEALLPSGGGGSTSQPEHQDVPNGDTGKDWVKNKLKALASLFGRLASRAMDALPGIVGSVIAWVLNVAKDAVGWLSQNLWALMVGVGGLIYTYMMTRK